jgi:hypothetical protein
MDSRNLPTRHAPIDRTAFERVLARAVQLHSAGGEAVDQFTEEQLIEIGREVGLSAVHVKQALAEERTRVVVPEQGRVSGLIGPTHIETRRMVRVSPSSALQRLDRWMDKEEALQVKRRSSDRMTWEARRDFLGSIKRGFNVGGRGYALSSASEVAATSTQVDEGSALVSLAADYSAARRNSIFGAAALLGAIAAVSTGVVALAVVAGGSLLVAAAGCAILGATGVAGALSIARANRKLVARGQLALEQALDRVEAEVEQPPASVLGTLLDAAVREFKT